jgi:serine/threonine protein kinase
VRLSTDRELAGTFAVEGTPFGRYLLIERLGCGGMGAVWRAHDTAIGRTFALKMLLPHFAQDKTFEQRFRREAQQQSRQADIGPQSPTSLTVVHLATPFGLVPRTRLPRLSTPGGVG